MIKKIDLVFFVAYGVLVFSGCMDLVEWFLAGYLVPSWTISILTFANATLLFAIHILFINSKKQGKPKKPPKKKLEKPLFKT